MIVANKGEQFSQIFIFYDLTGHFIENYPATYLIADALTDNIVSSGTMSEGFVGIHVLVDSLSNSGDYICYANCSGTLINEEIKILPENIYDLVKSRRNYNQSYENIERPVGAPDASQVLRGVPENETDYIIHRVKNDYDSNWDNPTASGNAYPHYRGSIPYKIEGV